MRSTGVTDSTGRIVVVSVTQAGQALAGRLPWERHHGSAASTIHQLWGEVDAFILMLATGAAVRIIAPLLFDKRTDPAVVCVDEAGHFAVALCGGHEGGANDLARDVAALLGATPVVTTASDAVGIAGLDNLPGFVAAGDVVGVSTALLDGRGVTVTSELPGWEPPGTLPHTTDAGAARIVITERTTPEGRGIVRLHPPCLVLGVGSSTDATVEETTALVNEVLTEFGLATESVDAVGTIDRRANHAAIVGLGRPVRSWSATELAAVTVPNPSEAAQLAVGTPSVAEAAALLTAGPGATLIVAKRTSPRVTVAVARRAGPRGQLAVVGLGPGGAAHRTPAAAAAVRTADLVIGYDAYIDQAADLLGAGQEIFRSPLGDEVMRAKHALVEAARGRRVALVCSGDAGIYAMASIVLELADTQAPTVEVSVVPGVTASVASAAVLGAPLGHDHATISLSDLLTPWSVIVDRLRAAADADLVVALYNPRSRGRTWQLSAALEILGTKRAPITPVGIVTDAGRHGQRSQIATLATLDVETVGMTTCVIIGSSTTRVVAGRMVTPRGYQR